MSLDKSYTCICLWRFGVWTQTLGSVIEMDKYNAIQYSMLSFRLQMNMLLRLQEAASYSSAQSNDSDTTSLDSHDSTENQTLSARWAEEQRQPMTNKQTRTPRREETRSPHCVTMVTTARLPIIVVSFLFSFRGRASVSCFYNIVRRIAVFHGL